MKQRGKMKMSDTKYKEILKETQEELNWFNKKH